MRCSALPRSLPCRAALLLLLALAACTAPGRYVWIDEYREEPLNQDTYFIRGGDVLTVNVWNQRDITGKVRVREDGRISLPLVDDVDAAGLTPPALARRIQERLKGLVNNAVVTVQVEESQPLKVAVLGEVKEPGMKTLEPGSGLLQALAMAGGFTDYAQPELLYVLRPVPGGEAPVRIRFRYYALIRTEGRAAGFRLRSGDVVVVE